MRTTHRLTRPDHPPIEYRRAANSTTGILRLEARELKGDGTPHDDRWYPVDDGSLLWLQWQDGGTAIIDALRAEQVAESDLDLGGEG